MKIPVRLVLCTTLVGAAALVRAEGGKMQPGQWEISVKMEMEGAPPQFANMPPMVFQKCVQPKDAKDPQSFVKSTQHRKDDCEMKDVKQSAGKFTWKMECKNGGKGSGEITFGAGSYDGLIVTEMADKGGVVRKMTSHISGKRVGDCKEAAPAP